MRCVLQRVSLAEVWIEGKRHVKIGEGILGLVGFSKTDQAQSPHHMSAIITRMAEKILRYRLFADELGKMNQSVMDKSFEVLLVPQFTVCADTTQGLRPSFSTAATPEWASNQFDQLVLSCQEYYHPEKIRTGIFGADMSVGLVNGGPVTFVLDL